MNLSARDILARTLEAEAGNQGALGMMSVGSVIMNRLKNPAYGSDIHSVILQPGQFSVWNKATGHAGGSQGRDMSSVIPSETAFMVTDQLLDQNYNDPTGGATHFYNPSLANPSWGKTAGGEWKTIGDHLFGVPVNSESSTMSLLNPNNQNTSSNPPNLFQYIGNAVGGGLENLGAAISGEDQDKSDRLAMAMMSLSGSPDLQPLIADAANNIALRAKTKTNNKTIEYLNSINPELAKLALADPSSIPNIISSIAGNTLNPKNKKGTVSGSELKKAYPNNVNIEDEKLYNVEYDSEGKVVKATPVGSGGINIDQTTETAWQKGSMNAIIEEFKVYSQGASGARQLLGQTNLLESLLNEAETGFGAGLASFVKNTFGIDVRNDAAAAAEAILSQLVPGQRAPGSGTMSDADLALYRNSLPQISNKPGGNAIIIATMKSIAEYQYKMGQIAQKAFVDDNYTPQMAYADMANLPDPLEGAMQFIKEQGIGSGDNSSPTSSSLTWDPTLNNGAGGFK